MHAHAQKARALVLVLMVAIALSLVTASSAAAAPSDETLGLSTLQTMLDASGTVSGYMKTVVQGSDIVTIPVTVKSIADGPLILFEATGSRIASYGGIVDGMSGSPIYVTDGGTDKVIGAVSYGEEETLGGTGLATPIEDMLSIKQKYSPSFAKLDHPVITSSGVIDSILVTGSRNPLPAATADRVAVVHPLGTPLFVRGMPTNSRMFKREQALLAKHNVTLVSMTKGRTTPALGTQSFETTLVPGASVAAAECRGDFWSGGIGTVTYTDSETVLAFGHPESQAGDSDIYMSNAWIDGVWPSTYEPTKFGRLGKLRGTITQDRGAGIMGVVGQFPDETTITAHATNTATGETTTSASYMPRRILDSLSNGDDFIDEWAAEESPCDAVYQAGAYLFDQDHTPGSAQTTTTIVVRDTDHDKLYTITIPNFVDDDFDIPSAIVWDVDDAVSSLRDLLDDDVYHFEILSIDLTSQISPHRKSATIVGVSVANGLKTGANPVTVSFLAHGVEATQTIITTLTIPAGVPTYGTLSASTSGNGVSQFPSLIGTSTVPTSDRDTVASVVRDLNSSLPGNILTLRYTPSTFDPNSLLSDGSDDGDDSGDDSEPGTFASVVTTVAAPWALDGGAYAYPTLVMAALQNRVSNYNSANVLRGLIFDGADDPGTISLYGTPAGSAVESLIATTTANLKTSAFAFRLAGLKVNTRLRVHLDSADGYLASDTLLTAAVRADVRLSSSASSVRTGRTVTLTTKVYPAANAGAKVTFEYYSKKAWRRISTKALGGGSAASASVAWKVPKGAYKVRVRFLGSGYNVATTSATRTVTGK